jgi:hypothetical protein
MDERLAKALAIVQGRTGFGSFKKPAASAKRTEGQHTDNATRSLKPRSQKGRKYSAKQEAKRAAWRREKGFKTRKEQLHGVEDYSTDSQDGLQEATVVSRSDDQPHVSSEAVKEATVNLIANPPAGSHTGSWAQLPQPTYPQPSRRAPVQTMEAVPITPRPPASTIPAAPKLPSKYTLKEAQRIGLQTTEMGGVCKYRDSGQWFDCLPER